jgi:hypothetical protein
MSADPAPDDMWLSLHYFISILKRRPAIRCPSHLEDAAGALYSLDTQTRAKAPPSPQVVNELVDRNPESSSLLGSEGGVILAESGGGAIRGQARV